METKPTCPICGNHQVKKEQLTTGDYEVFDCSRCGKYKISRSMLIALPNLLAEEDKKILLSHTVRKMQSQKDVPFLYSHLVESILKNELPSLSDQINYLLLWLGDNKRPGEKISNIEIEVFQTIIGAKTPGGTWFILDHLHKTN